MNCLNSGNLLYNDSIARVMRIFNTTHAWNLRGVDEKGKYLRFVTNYNILTSNRQELVYLLTALSFM